jgi:hypothetical protein
LDNYLNLKIMKKKLLLFCILTINIMMAQVPSYEPTNGLVGYWPFNGNANDESGNGNHGTVNGATLTADIGGNANSAYSFDGVSNYIQALNPLSNLTSNFSISCLVNIRSWQGGLFIHIGVDQNTNPRDGFGYGYGGTQAVYAGQNLLGLLSGIAWHQSGYQFSNLSTWHHAVIVRNANTLDYFVDGIFVGSNIITTIVQPSNALFFGSGAASYANFDGKIDDIGIWNRALTQAEITGLHTALGTEQTPANNQITIYPNPAKEQITIDCGTISNANGWSYKIVNTLGQEVLNGVISTQQNIISLNTLNGSGFYFVKIYDASNNLLNTKKIILQ